MNTTCIAIALGLLAFTPASGDLIEIRLEGLVDRVHIVDVPIRTSLRLGVPFEASFAYHDSLFDRGLFVNFENTEYPLTELVTWDAGGYSWEAPGMISLTNSELRIVTERTAMDGEFVAEVPVDGYGFSRLRAKDGRSFGDPPTLPSEFLSMVKLDSQSIMRLSTSDSGTAASQIETNKLLSVTEQRYLAGDANRDGLFNQRDLVQVLQASTYLTAETSRWGSGDWNGDSLFNQMDIVSAQQDGAYLRPGSAALAPIPEPSGILLLMTGVVAAVGWRTYAASRSL